MKSVTAFCLAIPAIFLIYKGLEKERLPYMEHNDALMKIDWNAGISVEENDVRVGDVLKQVDGLVQTSTAMVGVQDFVLSHTEDLTTSEAVVYFQAEDGETLRQAQEKIRNYMAERYPHGTVEFGVSGNIFDLIFSNDDADLEIRLQRQGGGRPDVQEARLSGHFVAPFSRGGGAAGRFRTQHTIRGRHGADGGVPCVVCRFTGSVEDVGEPE